MIFYLGTHVTNWLWKYDVPMFVSRRTLFKRRSFGRAINHWVLDSGGFSELSMYGKWETPAPQYVKEVRTFNQEIGNMDWAAIQDWMCEPFMIKKTGLSVLEHQKRTIDSYKQLLDLAPEINWTPVLQGYTLDEYEAHLDMYSQSGIELNRMPVVALGSICRRQHTKDAEIIIRRLTSYGLRIHGLGFKMLGLAKVSDVLYSADSLAWSFAARRKGIPLPGHTHKNCANCIDYALLWREKVLEKIRTSKSVPVQLRLDIDA